ncbi:MAG: 2-amino-4-hydroxy-6-hydroxymethyldihydropteridine diphosphokinase [Ignavibacterium sp.]|nr:2-amino-4-hydroxy-6-hydroxymethyldihydropteridine diphosphokinase [Ignavibacterium sp.]
MDISKINNVFIGLGSNKGDRLGYLQNALLELNSADKVVIKNISSVYETRPFGIIEQKNFYNAAVSITTDLTPVDLFKKLQIIEQKLGRSFKQKWGPREIDIDLLLYNDLIISNEFISLPHKGIIYRDFVLQPLCELDPEIIHPETNEKLCFILTKLEDKFIIKILPEKLFIPEAKY